MEGIPAEDKVWMKGFFEHLILDNYGIYTLWGSKPMVRFEMCTYSDEELSKLQGEAEGNENRDKVVVENYDFPEAWARWEKVRDQYAITQFLLFKKDNPDDLNLPYIFFVNVLETALVIQENYSLFRKYVGEDFDSLEVVFELQEKHSKFWDVVFGRSELVGLLYGFGLRNSFCFNWKYRENRSDIQDFTRSLNFKFSNRRKNYGDTTLKTLCIPIFAEFNPDDSMITRYETEKEKIKKVYEGQDFVECTMQRLTVGQ